MPQSVSADRLLCSSSGWCTAESADRAPCLPAACSQAGSPVCQVLFSCHGNGTEMSANTVSIAANGAFKCALLCRHHVTNPLAGMDGMPKLFTAQTERRHVCEQASSSIIRSSMRGFICTEQVTGSVRP